MRLPARREGTSTHTAGAPEGVESNTLPRISIQPQKRLKTWPLQPCAWNWRPSHDSDTARQTLSVLPPVGKLGIRATQCLLKAARYRGRGGRGKLGIRHSGRQKQVPEFCTRPTTAFALSLQRARTEESDTLQPVELLNV